MLVTGFWQSLDRAAQVGLLIGVSLIVVATAVGSYFILRTDYQVLFADMSMQDTSAMVAELDRLKIPYKLGDSGNAILVDKELVHKTRLTLMGRDVPLHGAVGLELFNTTDFGMTEFAQKINYQRALQGELTRTILSLPEVQDARVHLAFPEQGLFKQPDVHPKAAVYLTLKRNANLRQEQVSGVQRLVSAAVPGVAVQDVTIVDQHGVALTRPAEGGEELAAGSRFDIKRELENYLSHKVGEVLERAFGPGQAIASVDVSLDMDRVRLTQESVLGATGTGGQAAGVVRRERHVTHAGGASSDATANGPARGGNTEREVEYQVGRRVEQIISQPGSIQQLQVVALVRKQLTDDEMEKLKRVVAAAAGISPARGDTVEVQAIAAETPAVGGPAMPASAAGEQSTGAASGAMAPEGGPVMASRVITSVSLLLAAAAVAGIAYAYRGKRNAAPALTASERTAALKQIELWLKEEQREGPA